MADDFYNLKRIYEDYNTGTQTNMSQGAIATGPSYNTTNAMGGPGNEPVTIKGGAPASGDLFNWTNKNHMSVEQLTEIAEQAIKMALDQSHRADHQTSTLHAVYKQLLSLTSRSKE